MASGVVPDALGRDFEEVLRAIWPEPFVSEALGRFRHTLATGESYHAPSTVEQRVGSGHAEAYDWKVDRVLLPDGEPGVICYFHDLTERERVQRQLREAEVNKSFLLELSDALRPLADPAQLEGTACALMARHLGVDRAYFVWVDEAAGTARIITGGSKYFILAASSRCDDPSGACRSLVHTSLILSRILHSSILPSSRLV